MRLKRPFLKLPIRFDAEAIAAEVRALPPSAWTPHPTGFVGNEAVRLVTPIGEDSDAIDGPMGPTTHLQHCDYVRQIMAEIGGVWGRSRFMGLAAGSEVPPHIDIHYYWRTHWRIHIPVITNPGVEFTCGDETVHMKAGECWVFDSFLKHDVQNRGDAQRIHLVLDTVGGGPFADLLEAAASGPQTERFLRPGERSGDGLVFERLNSPKVMSPWEMRCHLAFTREQAGSDPRTIRILDRVEKFIDAWAAVWARFGSDDAGRGEYERVLEQARRDILALGISELEMPNEVPLPRMLDQLIFVMALAEPGGRVAKAEGGIGEPLRQAEPAAASNSFMDMGVGVVVSGSAHSEQRLQPPPSNSYRARFDRPVIVVSTPRSGSTLLYETLEQAPGLYSIGDESHRLIETVPGLAPQHRGWSSNRLTAIDATADRAEHLAEGFYRQLRDRDGNAPAGRARMLEKTPKNALRIPFFDALWPDSEFVYLYRDVRETLYSMLEAWQSGGFRMYPGLPGWQGATWSLLLVPGWRRLNGMPLPEIVAHQWAITTETMLDDLEQIPDQRVHVVDYGSFLASPQAEMESLAPALGLGWDRQLGPSLPLSKVTVSAPEKDKWRRIEPTINTIWPIVEKADARAREFVARRRAATRAAA
ncbi:hypothetical protein GCM10023264_02230 [Sphingomonas daechungensis]